LVDRIEFLLERQFRGAMASLAALDDARERSGGSNGFDHVVLQIVWKALSLSARLQAVPDYEGSVCEELPLSCLGELRAHLLAIENLLSELNGLEEAELESRYRTELEAENRENLLAELESDKTRFFHQLEAEAAFSYWIALPSWSEDEAVALSLGKDPKTVNSGSFKGPLRRVSPFAQNYLHRLEIVRRAVGIGDIKGKLDGSTLRIRPADFVEWGSQNLEALPEELLTIRHDRSAVQADSESGSDSLGKVRPSTWIRIFATLAIDKYGFSTDPSDVARARDEILDAAARIRCPINEDTVQDAIVEAATFLRESQSKFAAPLCAAAQRAKSRILKNPKTSL
jgi:hypothetical protein